jgi:uroporphyrinogen decarboxylase
MARAGSASDLYLRACRGEPVERPPLWVMRQAGRYLPEYRAVRERVDFVTLCRTPELATEVTLQPVDRFGFDAAILFSDILVPAEALGFEVEFNPGPLIDRPVRDEQDLDRMRDAEPEEAVPYVYEAIRMLRRELAGRVPLIGFAGAPFTLAAYLVEGRGSKSFEKIKGMLAGRPELAHRLLERVTRLTVRYVTAQVEAGAQAIQLFDSWAGLLGPADYEAFALRYAREVLRALGESGVPRIYFALNGAHVLDRMAGCEAEVIGVDWRTPLDRASALLGGGFALQGNLDPCDLFAPPDVLRRRVGEVLRAAAGLPGHVFNLGHGILPSTPIAGVETLVDAVRTGHGSRG